MQTKAASHATGGEETWVGMYPGSEPGRHGIVDVGRRQVSD